MLHRDLGKVAGSKAEATRAAPDCACPRIRCGRIWVQRPAWPMRRFRWVGFDSQRAIAGGGQQLRIGVEMRNGRFVTR